jgi:nitrogen fixation NifU-like protein
MTEAVEGKSIAEARRLFETFLHAMKGEELETDLGKLEAFRGVRAYPMRVKCATLAWHTLNAALEDRNDPITTEA